MDSYDDIINLPHYRSPNRKPMPVENRAAQFAPFAALSGHDEAIAETARITDERIELTNEEKLDIESAVVRSYETQSPVTIIYYCADAVKAGGTYRRLTGIVKKIDAYEKTIRLTDGTNLKLEDLISVR